MVHAETEIAGFEPPVPQTLEEIGLASSFVDDLLLKRLFTGGPQSAGEISDRLCLPLLVVIDNLNEMRRLHLTQVMGSRGLGESGYVYALTDEGEDRSRISFERNTYDGPAPVPMAEYVESVRAQSLRDVVVTRPDVEKAFADLELHPEIIDEIGPAINAGQSLFFYGAAGNGKTALATRITRAMGSHVYIPYAIETDGSVIDFYDPVSHLAAEIQYDSVDPRWIRVRRPTVVVGGELKLENLDLSYSPTTRTYEAPFQLKANTGMLLIDDFGRQQMRPEELLNRWIVPLEMRVDFLRLQSGRKLEVPFDELLVLSSNLDPSSLMDEAFLRRIKYKVQARDPSRDMFQRIFEGVCRAAGLAFDQAGFDYLVETHYQRAGRPFRGVHPRDLIDQLVSLCRFTGQEPAMTADLLDAVVGTYFLSQA